MKNVKEAMLYERIGENTRCLLCERKCLIKPNSFGFCKTRKNIDGKLYTLVYGSISAISANPMEKKPFFHFHPGEYALTFSTWNCNFLCPWCQNFEISKYIPENPEHFFIPPERIVEFALKYDCQGISVSFNEPSLLFEYSIDVFKISRIYGLHNDYVSNGYMTKDALRILRENGLDAINFDVKGNPDTVRKYCGANIEIVWRNIRYAKELGLHVEVVHLVVTGLNDNEETLEYIVENHLKYAGEDVPLHFTRYYPAYKYKKEPTRVEFLEKAYEYAKKQGVLYPYIGNVPGHKYENTYCHNCGELLIKRYSFDILKFNIRRNKCPKCGVEIPIVYDESIIKKRILRNL